jgi:hypothetical protein
LKTVPLTFRGRHLELNVQGEAVSVALVDARGRALEGFGHLDCDPLSGDHIAKRVTWQGRSGVARLAGQPVQLEFRLRQAKLYAFQFVP